MKWRFNVFITFFHNLTVKKRLLLTQGFSILEYRGVSNSSFMVHRHVYSGASSSGMSYTGVLLNRSKTSMVRLTPI